MIAKDNILQRIKMLVLKREPSAKIYLYGSRVKGTAKSDSDWDLLILLDKDKITSELYFFSMPMIMNLFMFMFNMVNLKVR